MNELNEKWFPKKVFRVYVDGITPFTYDWLLYNYEISDNSLKVIECHTADVVLFVPLDRLTCIARFID